MWKNTAFFYLVRFLKSVLDRLRKSKLGRVEKKCQQCLAILFTFLLKVSGKSRCQKMGFFGRVGHKNAKPMR